MAAFAAGGGRGGRFSPAVLRNTGEKSPHAPCSPGTRLGGRRSLRVNASLVRCRLPGGWHFRGGLGAGSRFGCWSWVGRGLGKSVTAERLLARRERVDYVACGPLPSPADPDWAERVQRHQERRPAHWTTMETLDLEAALAGRAPGDPDLPDPVPGDSAVAARAPTDVTQAGPETGHARRVAEARLATPVLVDCLSTWLAGVMEECGLWGRALPMRISSWRSAWTGCLTPGGLPGGMLLPSAMRSGPG